jgi:hypothetical protein
MTSRAIALPSSGNTNVLQARTECGDAPLPACTSCSDISFHSSTWDVTNLTYTASVIFSTPAHQIDGATVTLNLSNAALDYPMVCKATSSAAGVPFADGQQYTCTTGNETALDPSQGSHHGFAKATFTWDWPTTTLHVNESWTCNDNAGYP